MRRRKRFMVTVCYGGSLPQKKVCLGYTADSIRQYLERDPTAVVLKVDVVAKRKFRKGQPATWTVDWENVQAACETLHVTWPVRIRRTSSRSHKGAHRLGSPANFRITPVHYIVVEKTATPDRATEVLWHELAHAAQSERCVRESNNRDMTVREMMRCWGKHYPRSRKIPYAIRPCEVEANQIVGIYGDRPLTKPL